MSAQELILDDGFCFGLGAFETIAVMYGQPVFLEPHLKRLREALDFFGIPDPVTAEWVDEILKKHCVKNGVLKIMVSRRIVCGPAGKTLIPRRIMSVALC